MWFPRRLGVFVVVLAALIAGTATSAPAREPGLEYVALGDSYTAGSGGGEYQAEACRLSSNSYPELVAGSYEWDLRSQACAGARIQDVWDTQLAELDSDTKRISISIGGNDTGWVDVIGACMLAEDHDCKSLIDDARQYIRNSLYSRLRGLYEAIEQRAPEAAILVVGYPRLFAEAECDDAPGLSVAEQKWINHAADLLNRTTMRAAFAEHLWFVDVRAAFLGHAVCDAEPWIHGPSTTPGDAFHPTVDGYLGYADAVGWLWLTFKSAAPHTKVSQRWNPSGPA